MMRQNSFRCKYFASIRQSGRFIRHKKNGHSLGVAALDFTLDLVYSPVDWPMALFSLQPCSGDLFFGD